MKAQLIILFVILIATSACMSKKTNTLSGNPSKTILHISPTEAKQLIETNTGNPDFKIIDVRTKDEFENERIPDSIMIDYYNPNFNLELEKLDRNKTYLIYCRTGRRSGETLKIMQDQGFQNVYNMEGGIIKWKGKSYQTI